MFFFYTILIIVLIFINLILFTTIQIKITKLQISTIQKPISKYKIQLKLYLYKKINYLRLNITPTKIKRKTIQKNLNKLKIKIKIKKNKNNFDIRKLKELKNLKPELKAINLKLSLGLEDASKTAICTGTLSSIIAFFFGILSTTKSNLEESQTNWKIIPIYQNKNLLNIDLNCIINIKLIHIIYTIYKFSNKKQLN